MVGRSNQTNLGKVLTTFQRMQTTTLTSVPCWVGDTKCPRSMKSRQPVAFQARSMYPEVQLQKCGSHGQLDAIVHYNEYDAFTTFLLWARVAHFCNLLSDSTYEQEQMLVEQLLEKEIASGKSHLNLYLEKWRAMRW
jgi:hypothetical protein